MNKLISLPAAGRLIGKSSRAVKRLIESGQLAAIQIPGSHARVNIDDVRAFVPPELRQPPVKRDFP